MKLLIADQTPLDEASRALLKVHFAAEELSNSVELSELAAMPLIFMTPFDRRLLVEPAARMIVPSTIIITEPTSDSASLYEAFLTAGVLDILLAPLPPSYLGAKMRTLIQRARTRAIQDFLHVVNRLASKTLTQTELAFLKTIASKGATGASREQLQSAAWGDAPAGTRSLDTHLFNLRKKLEDLKIDIQYRRADRRWTLVSANPAIALPVLTST